MLAALKAHRAAVLPLVEDRGGRLVKTTGDGLLIEFPSVSAAVEAASMAQALMAERNRAESEGRRIRFRIGIHLGDVIFDEGDVYGDGVNIAARLCSRRIPMIRSSLNRLGFIVRPPLA